MYHLILNVLIVCSLSLQAADDTPLSASTEQAAATVSPLVTQLKDLICNAGPAEALQQYKTQLKDAQDLVLQKVRDAVDAYDTGITVAYDIHESPIIDAVMNDLLIKVASPEINWDGKKLRSIAQDSLSGLGKKTQDRVNTLLSFLRNHGELGWQYFEHFKTEMNARPFVDRKEYLDNINERIEDLKKTVKDIDTAREWKAHNNLVMGTLGLVEVEDKELDEDEESLDAILKESEGWPANRRAANFILHIKY